MNGADDDIMGRLHAGQYYHVVHLGRRIEVRAIMRSSKNPQFWICEDLQSREQILIPTHAFRVQLKGDRSG